MQAIARPDGRDMSVSDIPFNWNAQLDITKLRVGYIKESFDGLTNASARENANRTLETLRSIGVSRFVPVEVPEMTVNPSGLGVESTAFFDEAARAGLMKEARGGGRANARLIPAVDYLQSQRVRMMMMVQLAEATAGVDVYVVASNNNGMSGGGRATETGERGADGSGGARSIDGSAGGPGTDGSAGGRGTDGSGSGRGADGSAGGRSGDGGPGRTTGAGGGGDRRPRTPTERHSMMANLACYPAINVPNGFSETGSPTNVTLFGRPYGEMEILALAKAYQDAARFHLMRPEKLDT
jgi:Asp-tRNA(Asn)/Glu-tRNA(Gln) amidotransferase A subunit family amidase